jgi:hypothetical protein
MDRFYSNILLTKIFEEIILILFCSKEEVIKSNKLNGVCNIDSKCDMLNHIQYDGQEILD